MAGGWNNLDSPAFVAAGFIEWLPLDERLESIKRLLVRYPEGSRLFDQIALIVVGPAHCDEPEAVEALARDNPLLARAIERYYEMDS